MMMMMKSVWHFIYSKVMECLLKQSSIAYSCLQCIYRVAQK